MVPFFHPKPKPPEAKPKLVCKNKYPNHRYMRWVQTKQGRLVQAAVGVKTPLPTDFCTRCLWERQEIELHLNNYSEV
jgi:hypothetical protein